MLLCVDELTCKQAKTVGTSDEFVAINSLLNRFCPRITCWNRSALESCTRFTTFWPKAGPLPLAANHGRDLRWPAGEGLCKGKGGEKEVRGAGREGLAKTSGKGKRTVVVEQAGH